MLSLRNRFGIPGVISVIALVFAMLGGAYAASQNGTGKATASAKAKKGPRGPKGATGPAGPAGAQGPAGANGKDGSNGTNGSNGAAGATGPAGPTGPAGATGATGATGTAGAKGATGATGATGEAGETGFTETLPEGMTETGAWSYGATSTPGEIQVTASFAIPLAAPLGAGKAHYIYRPNQVSPLKELVLGEDAEENLIIEEVEPEACHGTAEEPTADPGNFCMYVGSQTGTLDKKEPFDSGIFVDSGMIGLPGDNTGFGRAGTTGAHLPIKLFTGSSEAWGTWAVTAP
jgi:hypothetical protein